MSAPLRNLGLASLLVFVVVNPSEADEPSQQLLCVGQKQMVLLDAEPTATGEIRKLWTWTGETAAGIPDDQRKRFGNLDDAKPIREGREILVTASNGGCALVDRISGAIRWQAAARNAHSIELLPRDRVVVASSLGGDELIVFDLATSYEARFRTPLRSAHGVVWDAGRQTLWALGFDVIQAYSLSDWETEQPRLVLRDSYKLPDDDGHDLREIPNSNDLLLSTAKTVQLFDRDAKQFREHPELGTLEHIKSADVHPATGRIVLGRWKPVITLHHPAGTLHLTDYQPYKVRWFPHSQ